MAGNTPDCRYFAGPDTLNAAHLLHTFAGGCTASPSVGRRVDAVKRFRQTGEATPNGTTERQHRITGDALATAAPNNGISLLLHR
jgi:hypothetical protein